MRIQAGGRAWSRAGVGISRGDTSSSHKLQAGSGEGSELDWGSRSRFKGAGVVRCESGTMMTAGGRAAFEARVKGGD